jgi:hypothetical protein
MAFLLPGELILLPILVETFWTRGIAEKGE